MVKTRQGFVLAASFLSGLALALSLVSIGTEQWVVADGEFTIAEANNEELSTIKYGLFSGTILQRLTGNQVYEIKMTCLLSDNVCAYLCESSPELRKEELNQLFRGDIVEFNAGCPRIRRMNFIEPVLKDTRKYRNEEKREFLNAGLYISTTTFLCISIIFGVISTALSIWNTAANPIEVYLSIYGLYVYNSIACVGCLFALVLWGALFGSTIANNVGILYTIRGQMDSSGLANLGYSYWLLLPSCLLYSTSIAVLYMRQYLISQEPEIKIHTTSGDKDVGEIMIY